MLMNVLEEERPTSGRPQGSHPLTLTTPALTKIRGSDESHRIFVRAGGGLTRGGDPCGRPEVGFLGQMPLEALGRPMEKRPCVMLLRRLPRPISPKNLPV